MRFKAILQEYLDVDNKFLSLLKETTFKRALSQTFHDKFKDFWECRLFECIDSRFIL